MPDGVATSAWHPLLPNSVTPTVMSGVVSFEVVVSQILLRVLWIGTVFLVHCDGMKSTPEEEEVNTTASVFPVSTNKVMTVVPTRHLMMSRGEWGPVLNICTLGGTVCPSPGGTCSPGGTSPGGTCSPGRSCSPGRTCRAGVIISGIRCTSDILYPNCFLK